MTQIISGKMNYSLVFFSFGLIYLWLLTASHRCAMSSIPELLFNLHYVMVYSEVSWHIKLEIKAMFFLETRNPSVKVKII